MAYRVLARKYRPQLFQDIVGQAHIATTLSNALKSGKVAHAYLFAGPRGVGKTTTARILAKALNCEKGPTATPCNACDSCQRIALGQEMVDVLEIDAASNRGIEEIRELRENVRYAPAHSRYKVYIVDEAHQITHDAFNAFLKTLEEPPEHAVFILATTEHQKIPTTILSRCQLFRFKRISVEDIIGRLQWVLAQEKVSVEPAALGRLARAAGGSIRDALSLLDQALAYTTDRLTLAEVELLLGFLPEEFLQDFAGALLAQEPTVVLQKVRRLTEEGWEMPQFVRDFREYLRQAIVDQLSAGTSPQSLKLGSRTVPLAQILLILKTMGQCLDEMRWNENPRLVLELYSLRLTQPFVDAGDLLRRLESLEGDTGRNLSPSAPPRMTSPSAPIGDPSAFAKASADKSAIASATADKSAIASATADKSAIASATADKSALASATAGKSGSSAEASTKSDGSPITTSGMTAEQMPSPSARPPLSPVPSPQSLAPDSKGLWKQFLAELWKKPGVASLMERSHLKSASDTEWMISLPDRFALESAQRAQAFVQEILVKVAGDRVAARFVQEAAAPSDENPVVAVIAGAEPSEPAASQDTGIQKVLQTFKGRVRPTESNEP